MTNDKELEGLFELSGTALEELIGDDIDAARVAARDEEARALAYLEDLQEILQLSSGAGVRVLRHWLDNACANERLSRTNASVYGATALYDYARDRMADMPKPCGPCLLKSSCAKSFSTKTSNEKQGRYDG